MYKVRRIGKFAEQSGPQLLRADTRRREKWRKKEKIHRDDVRAKFLQDLEKFWTEIR